MINYYQNENAAFFLNILLIMQNSTERHCKNKANKNNNLN